MFALLLAVAAILALTALWQHWRVRELQRRIFAKDELETVNRECMVAGGFYDNILEADVTCNQLIGSNCANLTALLGIPQDTTFSDCIEAILEKMVSKEYHDIYRECFDRKGLLRKFEQGQDKFMIEFIEKSDLIHESWTRATICLYYSQVSGTVRVISYVNNIQQEKQKELNLLRLINTDYLTGLFNKRAAEERIHALLAKEIGIPRHHALLMIDIDRFKQVNDTIGHAGGDKALCIVARLMERHFESDDIVSRIGGDEFLVLVKDFNTEDYVRNIAESLIRKVASPETAAEVGMQLSLSVGIALYPEHGIDYPALFEAADCALYHVKKHNRNGYCLYGKTMLCEGQKFQDAATSDGIWREQAEINSR